MGKEPSLGEPGGQEHSSAHSQCWRELSQPWLQRESRRRNPALALIECSLPPPPSPHAATGLYFYHFRGSVLKKQERFCWRKIKLKFIFLFSLEQPWSFCTSIIYYLLPPPHTPYFLIPTQPHTWSLEARIHPSLGCTICFSTGDPKYSPLMYG